MLAHMLTFTWPTSEHVASIMPFEGVLSNNRGSRTKSEMLTSLLQELHILIHTQSSLERNLVKTQKRKMTKYVYLDYVIVVSIMLCFCCWFILNFICVPFFFV